MVILYVIAAAVKALVSFNQSRKLAPVYYNACVGGYRGARCYCPPCNDHRFYMVHLRHKQFEAQREFLRAEPNMVSAYFDQI